MINVVLRCFYEHLLSHAEADVEQLIVLFKVVCKI